jgi:hypothetical protein
MPELGTIRADHYDFVVWSKDITKSRNRLSRTLNARGKQLLTSVILVAPAIKEKGCSEFKNNFDLGQSVFFENKQYDIEFVFNESFKEALILKPPCIEHSLRIIEDAFHYSSRTNSLRGTLNTGNDIGWFRFELVYSFEGTVFRQSFSFEILPVKMDMESDLQIINEAIDDEFPLWRFSLAEKTQHQMQAVKKPHPEFLLLWLAQFETLLGDLRSGLKHIINSPHSRLMPNVRIVKMDRLKGKLSSKLEQDVIRAKADHDMDKRFKLDKKVLSVDTPENRFIKFVISSSISKLSKITIASRKNQVEPDKQRLSDSFFKKLDRWQSDMRVYYRQPLFREVGQFSGLSKESLVLQQKPGYSKVYKAWQQLRCYLDLLEGDSNLSLRSVSELYEIWCFLEVRRILLELGFEEKTNSRIPMVNNIVDVSFKDGMQGTFKLKRRDGIKLRLAHEPKFLRNGTVIKSWTTPQKPDIFLEATFTDGEKVVWLFDAKYRINTPSENNDKNTDEKDYVPEDAINQMHRYRDALIHMEKSADHNDSVKTRPVFGAYALYPGFYDQNNDDNPYATEIEEVGIGAFSLLPASDGSGSIWLTRFLTEKLSKKTVQYDKASPDRYFVEEAPRIPYHGTQVSRFNDLVIAANQLGPSRDTDYIDRFMKGDAPYYHTRQIAFQRQSIEHHVIHEARYIAVAIDVGFNKREVEFIYPILKATLKKRGVIDSSVTGTNNIKDEDELYWLFELGKSLKLKKAVVLDVENDFRIKLVSREELSCTSDWEKLSVKYSSVM